MKLTTIASTIVIGGTVAASLALNAPRAAAVTPRPPSAVLPITGPATGIIRVRHSSEISVPTTPVEIYEQYVPPLPTPAPIPAPAPAPVRAWVPPAGYVTFGVPVYHQTRALNCETAALQMGLAYYGHWYSQDALFAYENPDLRAAVNGPNWTITQWGDPYTNFVGNVNGSESAHTGYGVYYPVILSIARSHGAPNSYGGEGLSAATVYAELAAGHPVEVWIEANWSRPRMGTWTAWDGRRVRYSIAEHAVTLTGVSATSVRVNDPEYGSQYWVSKATFQTVWSDFDNMAVVIR